MKRRQLATLFASSVLAVLIVRAPVRGEEPVKPDAEGKAPAGLKDPTKIEAPAKPAVQASAEAQSSLDATRDAYRKLASLQLAGKLTADFDVDGQVVHKEADFTASFAAPNKFRHEMKEFGLLGSTGEKIFAFQPSKNNYMMSDAPKDRAPSGDIPKPMGQILDQQNPSLLLALVPDAGVELVNGVKTVDKLDDVKIGEVSYAALKFVTAEASEITVLFDPQTQLVRRVTADMKKAIEASGQQEVKKAFLTIDYTDVKPDAPVQAEQFAWAPPAGAKDASKAPAGEEEEEASPLEGKAAPDFALKGMDGKEVKLADAKGKVLIVDFWATWCPPCRASLPHLDKLGQEMKDKGVLVYAINQKEDKDDINKFVEKTKMTTPILLDAAGAMGDAYGVTGIPQTVVIGKDGKVKKVFVGFSEQTSPKALEAAVKAALAE